MKNLVFLEGISGAGKSTLVTRLCQKLAANGYRAIAYMEGDIYSPLDLFWSALLTRTEYEQILYNYPDYVCDISRNSIFLTDYVLVRYQDLIKRYFSAELYKILKSHEFCYHPAHPQPLAQYTQVFSELWQRFATVDHAVRDYVVMDGSLMHHQINDLMCNYGASEDDIVQHLAVLLQAVRSLSPIVFYLSSQNAEKQLTEVWESRGKAAPTAETTAFWLHRKSMDLRVLDRLDVESHHLDVTNNEWDAALDVILQRLTEQTAVIDHYDALIDENNDPVHDPEPLCAYMDKWDGAAFIEALQLSPEKSVLEIGVGTGRLAVRICSNCARFTGIDFSPKTIERARNNLRAFTNTNLLCGDYLTYTFPTAFDVIYSSLTFMHIKDKQSAIEKIARLLAPGGRFVLSISKEQATKLDFGKRTLAIYPDDPKRIGDIIESSGLYLENQFETEFALVFVSRKVQGIKNGKE